MEISVGKVVVTATVDSAVEGVLGGDFLRGSDKGCDLGKVESAKVVIPRSLVVDFVEEGGEFLSLTEG
jgi:hypothetical protein